MGLKIELHFDFGIFEWELHFIFRLEMEHQCKIGKEYDVGECRFMGVLRLCLDL